jgi:hypothetical protein
MAFGRIGTTSSKFGGTTSPTYGPTKGRGPHGGGGSYGGGATIEHTFQLCSHQWLARDHSWYETGAPDAGPGGFKTTFKVPQIVGDPVSIKFATTMTGMWRWIWQNLGNIPMDGSPGALPLPHAVLEAKHFYEWSKGGEDRERLSCGNWTKHTLYSKPLTAWLGGYWDGTAATCNWAQGAHDQWSFQCNGTFHPCQLTLCTGSATQGPHVNAVWWSWMSNEEKKAWRDGMSIQYAPIVGFIYENIPGYSNVPWETTHTWWNWSDIRASVEVKMTITY